MKCPECSEYLEPNLLIGGIKPAETEHVDVDFKCSNNHIFFVRIKPDDLIPAQ